MFELYETFYHLRNHQLLTTTATEPANDGGVATPFDNPSITSVHERASRHTVAAHIDTSID